MLEFRLRADESTTKCQCDRRAVCGGGEKVWRLSHFAVLMDIDGLAFKEVFTITL